MKWTTQKRKINDLIPYEYNPRQMTDKQNEDLKKSLDKFDLVEIPAINTDGTVLAGHQRLRLMKVLGRGDEEIDVRVPDRALTAEEVQEYNIRSNKNTGSFDFDILANNFEITDLKDWGFTDYELNLDIPNNPEELWKDMPEFSQQNKEAYRTLLVHFNNDQDVQDFANLIQQNITEKTRFIYYPKLEIEKVADLRIVNEP